MSVPASQITIDDGTTVLNISGYATLELTQQFSPILRGSGVTRFQDGTSIKQSVWRKQRIRIQGRGWVPSGLEALDYDVQQTWTIQDDTGTRQVTVWANPPEEDWQINAATTNWRLTGEEV